MPEIGEGVYIADEAVVIGRVKLGKDCSIWHNASLRADCDAIEIGEGTSVQENAVVHETPGLPTKIGRWVTVGHGAIVHGAVVEDKCLIGMGSVVLDGAHVGHGSIVGAGSVVPPNMQIPPHSQVMGIPARIVKQLPQEREDKLYEEALGYIGLKNMFIKSCLAKK